MIFDSEFGSDYHIKDYSLPINVSFTLPTPPISLIKLKLDRNITLLGLLKQKSLRNDFIIGHHLFLADFK